MRQRFSWAATESLEGRRLLTTIELGSLDGSTGFRIDGIDAGDQAGVSVSGAGDVNGDGFDDIIIGSPLAARSRYTPSSGQSYVVFGKSDGFGSAVDLDSLDGNTGFRIDGTFWRGYLGRSVSGAGDINGDGFDDLVIGETDPTSGYYDNGGASYVIFGKSSGFASAMSVTGLDGSNGFRISGGRHDRAGNSVSSAGDVNGDGLDDLLISKQPGFDGGTGFVLLGKSTGYNSHLKMDASNGFIIQGVSGERTRISVSSAGDFNGDSLADLIVGSPSPNSDQSNLPGASFLLFGKSSGAANFGIFDPSDSRSGLRIDGIDGSDRSGHSVGSAGDVNGDGFDDVIIGAYRAGGEGAPKAGESYLVFGKSDNPDTTLNLSTLDGSNGFRIDGIDALDYSGRAVSGAGDVNGDGFDDLLIGATNADPGGNSSAGESYVLFGKSAGFGGVVELNNLDDSGGIQINGAKENDLSGISVSSAGDINGDGFDDLLVGATGADPRGEDSAGTTYVIFGRNFASGIETQVGDAATDTLVATQGANGRDVLIGGLNDDILISDGGPDVLRGGQGNDTLAIVDTDFRSTRRLVGGTGTDTLRLDGTTLALNLTHIPDNRLLGIEQIDLTGSGPNTVALNLLEVLNLSDESNTLVVHGDNLDQLVLLDGGWVRESNEIIGDVAYRVLTQGAATLKVAAAISRQTTIDLANPGAAATTIFGAETNDRSGFSISSAGDVNGDGFDDMLIGARYADGSGNAKSYAGDTYVVFGGDSLSATIDLADLGSAGITIFGAEAHDDSGRSVSSAGDVNGDGFDDVLIGAPYADAAENDKDRAGDSYVVFGGESLPETIDLAGLETGGITISGADWVDSSGYSVSSAGDVNGDGFDDILIGARNADAAGNEKTGAGESYVIFGGDSLPPKFDLSNLRNTGLTIFGADENDRSGVSVSSAGDVNGDGFDDILIGAYLGDGAGNFRSHSGETYVVFGGDSLPTAIDLANLGTNGMSVFGADGADRSGRSVSSAGDVNGDGFDDILIGVTGAEKHGFRKPEAGVSYLIFGGDTLPTTIDLFRLENAGIAIVGADSYDSSGISVSSAGDVNGDGFDDILVGAPYADAAIYGRWSAGDSYVIFGSHSLPNTIDLANPGMDGLTLFGSDLRDQSGRSVSNAGDVNGDGFGDVLIGARFADASGNIKDRAGDSYVVFGGNFTDELEMQVGTDANSGDILVATRGAGSVDILVGGLGDDVLISDGGPDVLRGGHGNDTLAIVDVNFMNSRKLDGGSGTDTLRLDGSGLTLDLTSIPDNRVTDVEGIDLGHGANTLILDVHEVLNISSHTNTLTLRGNSTGIVDIGLGWDQVEDIVVGEQTFEVFTQGAATLNLEETLTVTASLGNVDGDLDFDANDSFLIHMVKLSGTNGRIDQSKGVSELTANEIRTTIEALQIAADVDGDGDFDANDSFLIHLVKLAGTDAQINQSKGSSVLNAIQIRANVNSLGESTGRQGNNTQQTAVSLSTATTDKCAKFEPSSLFDVLDRPISAPQPQILDLTSPDSRVTSMWSKFRSWVDKI